LTEDKLKHILVMFMLANTLMFVFLSSSVGYDPLVLLFSFLSIILVLKLLKRNSLILLIILIISLLAGMLTKISFLPIVLVIGGFTIIHLFKEKKGYLKEIRDFLKRKEQLKYLIPLLVIMCFFLFLSLNLYLSNIIKHKSFTPSCTQVMTEEDCMKSGEFSSYSEIHENAPPREERIEPYWYVPHWVHLMTDRTYGIFGHKTMMLSYNQFASYFTLLILGSILFIRKFDIKNNKQIFLVVLSLSYISILMFYTNYQGYLSYGLLHAAVQGRYIFPVIVPIYILIVYGLLSFKNKYIRAIIFWVVLFIYLYGNIPFFIKNFTEDWFINNSWGTHLILNARNLVYTVSRYLGNLLN
jgi:hypothetical protein